MSELDNEELIATRRLHGLDDNLFKEGNDTNVGSMTEEAFNELIDNFEVVAHLTPYGRKGIKENVKRLQARIKELEEENAQLEAIKDEAIKRYNFESIPVQKVKVKIEELDIAILECEYADDDVEEYKNDVEKEKRILLIKKSALEELLEEK